MASRGLGGSASGPELRETGPGPDDDGDDGVSREDVFTLLSNRRRRYALHIMTGDGTDDQYELGPIAEQIAAWENDTTVREITSDERKRVYTALQQTHLPKMDEAGVVEFDKNRGTIRPTGAIEDVDIYLEVVEGRDIPWSEYYLGLGAVSLALVAAVWVNAWPLTLLPDVAWAACIAAGVTFSALAHVWFTWSMQLSDSDEPPEIDDAET